MVDISRNTSGLIELPKEISTEIWTKTSEASVVQTLARRIEMPAAGLQIPIITGDPEAGWVGETEEKPVSSSTFGSKTLRPYKMAVIELFSEEFARDMGAVYSALVERLPQALSRKFDKAALGFEASPGTGFDTLAGAPAVSLDGTTPDGYFNALQSVTAAEGDITAWALSPAAEIDAMRVVDGNGNPMLVPNYATTGQIGTILARPTYGFRSVASAATEEDSAVVGFAGEWNSAMWGFVEGIRFDIQRNVTVRKDNVDYHLWQRNMFAIRAEVEVGFAVRDVNRFVRLTKGEPVTP